MSGGQKIARLAVAVSVHFSRERLQYLKTVAGEFCELASDVLVYIVTNAGAMQQDELRAILNPLSIRYEFVLPTKLGHPYLLTWSHLWLFRDLFERDLTVTHFLYLEDDIHLTAANMAFWLRGREELRLYGLIPSFLRYERNEPDGELYSSDVTSQINLDSAPQLTVDRRIYLNLPQPYQGTYLFDRELMEEHLKGLSSNPDFGPWGIREKAAQGLTFLNVPSGFTSRNLVGYLPELGCIDPDCLVHHLPNNYVLAPDTQLGKTRVRDIIRTSPAEVVLPASEATVVPSEGDFASQEVPSVFRLPSRAGLAFRLRRVASWIDPDFSP